MIEDPWELNNLADDPQYAAKKAELRTAMEAWMADVGDLGQETEMKALERLWENAPAPDPGDPSEPAVGWVKVTSDRSDWSGNYLVVRDGVDYPRAWNLTAQNNNNIFVMVASNNAIKAAGTSQGGANIPLEELHDYTVTLDNTGNGYTMLTATGMYVTNTSGAAGTVLQEDCVIAATSITLQSDNTFEISLSNNTKFGYYPTNKRFNYFPDNKWGDKVRISLYEYVE